MIRKGNGMLRVKSYEFANTRPHTSGKKVMLLDARVEGQDTWRNLIRSAIISEREYPQTVFSAISAWWALHKDAIACRTGEILWIHLVPHV